MSGVGGRETRNLNQAFALQGGDRPLRVHGCGQRPQRLRAGPHQVQQLGFAGRQLVAHAGRGRAKGQQHKAPVHRAAAVDVGQIGLEQRQGFREARRQQRHGDDALRPDLQPPVRAQSHLAVAAQADGAHINRPHHGAPAADFGTVQVHARQAVDQRAHIGGGAAHVGEDEVVQAAEPARAHETGRRAREHGLNRSLGHALGQRQRAVALDDHQRADDVQLFHGAPDRVDQMRDPRDQPRVQGRGQRAARRVQAGRQLGRQGDRFAAALHDARARLLLVRRVAHRERSGEGKGVDLRGHAVYGRVQRLQVQGRCGFAVVVVPTGDALHRHAGEGLGNAGALGHGCVKADQQHADRAAVALDHGVGGQRGGHRDQRNILRAQALGQGGNGLGNRIAHAQRQVALGGDGLGGGDDALATRLDDGGVGVGAAGVDANQVLRGGGRRDCGVHGGGKAAYCDGCAVGEGFPDLTARAPAARVAL